MVLSRSSLNLEIELFFVCDLKYANERITVISRQHQHMIKMSLVSIQTKDFAMDLKKF